MILMKKQVLKYSFCNVGALTKVKAYKDAMLLSPRKSSRRLGKVGEVISFSIADFLFKSTG